MNEVAAPSVVCRLSSFLGKHNLSEQDLQFEIRRPQAWVNRIKNGRQKPRLDSILLLLQGLSKLTGKTVHFEEIWSISDRTAA